MPAQAIADFCDGISLLLEEAAIALSQPLIFDSSVVVVGDARLDLVAHTLESGREIVRLRSRECELLAYLMIRPATVVSYSEIRRNVWRQRDDIVSNAIHMTLSNLRGKLAYHRCALTIVSVRGTGVELRDLARDGAAPRSGEGGDITIAAAS